MLSRDAGERGRIFCRCRCAFFSGPGNHRTGCMFVCCLYSIVFGFGVRFWYLVLVLVLVLRFIFWIYFFWSFSRYPLQSSAPDTGAEGFPLLSGLCSNLHIFFTKARVEIVITLHINNKTVMNMSEMSGNCLKNILEINIFPLKLIFMERYTDAGNLWHRF